MRSHSTDTPDRRGRDARSGRLATVLLEIAGRTTRSCPRVPGHAPSDTDARLDQLSHQRRSSVTEDVDNARARLVKLRLLPSRSTHP